MCLFKRTDYSHKRRPLMKRQYQLRFGSKLYSFPYHLKTDKKASHFCNYCYVFIRCPDWKRTTISLLVDQKF